MMLPRLAGIGQKAWTQNVDDTWGDYRIRLATHGKLWDQSGLTWFRSSVVDWTEH